MNFYRYYPPDVAQEHIICHRLLSMFHPRPFIFSRFPPQGTIAVIRARHGSLLDIYFRFVTVVFCNTDHYSHKHFTELLRKQEHLNWFVYIASFKLKLIALSSLIYITYDAISILNISVRYSNSERDNILSNHNDKPNVYIYTVLAKIIEPPNKFHLY